MFQKFNTDTLISRFIKNLVYSKPIPRYKFVTVGDWVTEGCYYCFGTNVILCTQSGELSDSNYKIVKEFFNNKNDFSLMNNLISKNTYYDYETHEQLGEYLRYLRGVYSLNLMPFYNCFSGHYVSTFSIRRGKYYEGVNNDVQVALFPIKFNQTYTIAVDCESSVDILPVVFSGGIPLEGVYGGSLINLSELLEDSYVQKNYSQFNIPFTFSVSTADKAEAKFLEQNEHCLNLAIQLPIKNTSSIVVLEGDFTAASANKVIDTYYVNRLSDKEIDNIFISGLSLLRLNDQNSYAFSDRLVEYLVKNVIDSGEDIDGNITAAQRALNLLDSPDIYSGVWDNRIRYDAFQVYKALYPKDAGLEFIDINGFIDKDIEKILNQGV